MRYHWLFVPSFLIAILLAYFVTAAVHWDEMWVKHSWNAVPDNWESLGNPAAGAMIDLHIALIPDRERALVDALSEISNPRHLRYGAYLTKEQVTELVSPPPETVDLVRAWLVHHDIRPSSISATHGGSWLTVTDVLVSQANQLLGATYQLYRNLKTNDTIIRTVGYALPAVLHTRIRTVAPTTYFPFTRGMRQTPRVHPFGGAATEAPAASGDVVTARHVPGITPSVLRWLYDTTEYRPKAIGRNKIGILGIENDYPNPDDLTSFMRMYRPEGADATFTVVQWNGGGYDPRNPSLGSNVGVQYATAIAYPTPVIFYSVGGGMQWNAMGPIAGDMYREWLDNLLDEPDSSIPQTISISYGHSELDLPPNYAFSLCELFGQLTARGVTVLVASGQDGVGAGDCVDAQGDVRFIPEFPSVCPYVTSVGGTIKARPELAANLSGGGFSVFIESLAYQDYAVDRYLRRYPVLYLDLFDDDGRAYPDISAQAQDYQFIMNGEMWYMNGTTCSVTTAAGIVSLMNDFLISHNRKSLGFLNPILYLLSEQGNKGIDDVKFGGNPGCDTDGFQANIGWDPVTGVGTLDFQKMLLYLKARYRIPDDPVEVPEPEGGPEVE